MTVTHNEKGPTSAPTLNRASSNNPTKDQKMNDDTNSTSLSRAPVSRRNFLSIAAAGAAATLPAVAIAANQSGEDVLSDAQQLEACIGRLSEIIKRMHPLCTKIHPHYLMTGQDGCFKFSLQGDVTYEEFNGPGVYEISDHGYLMTFWLERDFDRRRDGNRIAGTDYFRAIQWHNGGPIDDVRRMWEPRIVRKLEGVQSWTK